MKKIFSVEDGYHVGIADGEEHIYCVYSFDEHKIDESFYDSQGNLMSNYKRTLLEEAEDQYTDDPTQYTPMIEGYYGYTTHPVEYQYVDGVNGQFGIKNRYGVKITDEIFAEVNGFTNGLCSVRNTSEKWGGIDEAGRLVIPYEFCAPLEFNQYGVAYGNHALVDCTGTIIPNTELSIEGNSYTTSRYYDFGPLSEEQSRSIDQTGTAEDIRLHIYDTKLREYVVKDIPDGKLDVSSFEGEGQVILAAVEMMDQYDEIELIGKGTILTKTTKETTVFDYYQ